MENESLCTHEILEDVSRSTIQLLLQQPFYAHLFSVLNKQVVAADQEPKTMGVGYADGAHFLFINPFFWQKILLDPNHRMGVIWHEVLHILLKHTIADLGGRDPFLVNIAMDIVVNQYIPKTQLPAEGVFLEDFCDLKMEANETWQYYYEKLKQARDHPQQSNSRTNQLLAQIDLGGFGLERHSLWDKLHKLPPSEKNLLDAKTENQVRIAGKKASKESIGNLPAQIQTCLSDIMLPETPRINWRRILKIFAAISGKTRIRNTMKKPSKRFGVSPGTKVVRKKRLLVAVDTSGSISDRELGVFFEEIYHIWKTGAEIQIVECDVKIHNAYQYKGSPPVTVSGRGGTSFDAPIKYGNEVFQPDGLVYLTDGFAMPPKVKPRFPILWVITSTAMENNVYAEKLAGRKVALDL